SSAHSRTDHRGTQDTSAITRRSPDPPTAARRGPRRSNRKVATMPKQGLRTRRAGGFCSKFCCFCKESAAKNIFSPGSPASAEIWGQKVLSRLRDLRPRLAGRRCKYSGFTAEDRLRAGIASFFFVPYSFEYMRQSP